jgi:esterase
MVRLFHRDLGGEGLPPLVILHGLLGSSRNWAAAGKDLSTDFHVLALDLRNHGESPHTNDHSYGGMMRDVLHWLDRAGLGKVHLMGHSMGGKVAMRLACHYPERVAGLVIVDISPRAREPDHGPEFAALNALPLHEINSRAEADQRLAADIPSWGMRQFLLTNLVRKEDGRFEWQANLPVLTREFARASEAPISGDDRFEGPALWIVGGKSDFITAEDPDLIRRHFPRVTIDVFPESGHNPHIEDRVRFSQRTRRFLVEGR